MAHAILEAEAQRRGLSVEVCSASTWNFDGTMAAIEARLVCEKHNTPMSKLLTTPLQKLDLSDATRVLVMERAHIAEVLAQTGALPERVSLLGAFDSEQGDEEIEDPIGKELEAYEACYSRMRDCITHYLDTTLDFE